MLYDAVLLVSFGGPEGPADVIPCLKNVVRGRDVPEERLQAVARNYELLGGVSPINAANRAILAALQRELTDAGHSLPVFWGNRNWHPFLSEALREMAAAGVRRAIAFATSAYSSYSGCRQYLEDIERARAEVGDSAPVVHKIPPFYSHPGFIQANRDHLRDAIAELGAERPVVLFTAHSLPESMAATCDYVKQLEETSRLVLEGRAELESRLVYQSRSGPPTAAWLGPDVLDALREIHTSGARDVVLAPIGFVSDHMEVIYDLDVQARELAETLGLRLARAKTAGTHPRFIQMIRELIEGDRGQSCPAGCCPAASSKRPPA